MSKLSILFAILFFIILSVCLCGCEGDNSASFDLNSNNTPATDSIIDFEPTDSDADYSKYYELNVSYDSENRLTRTDIYSDKNVSDSKVSEIKTFTTDEKLKSTVKYKYFSDNDFSSSLFDEKDNFLFKMKVSSNGKAEKSEYYNSKDQLVMYKTVDSDGVETYYDKNDAFLKGSNLAEKKSAIERLYCKYLY